MAREMFKEKRFGEEALFLIRHCNSIINDYQEQGLRLTLRQLYYQLVTKNLILNEEKSYKKVGKYVSDARLAGLMDWDAIEDRGRQPRIPAEFEDLSELVDAALQSYRLPRWKGQKNYAELWVEKEALAGVLRPLASEFHVTLMVNKGYSSQSAMYESANRFQIYCSDELDEPRQPILFYLGDHDPSGEDMVEDIKKRMVMFGVYGIDVRKLALTTAQKNRYNPPPNPAKTTDSRFKKYAEKHGHESWEVDALPPNILARIIRSAFDEIIDRELMDDVRSQEVIDKQLLTNTVKELMKKKDEKKKDEKKKD